MQKKTLYNNTLFPQVKEAKEFRDIKDMKELKDPKEMVMIRELKQKEK